MFPHFNNHLDLNMTDYKWPSRVHSIWSMNNTSNIDLSTSCSLIWVWGFHPLRSPLPDDFQVYMVRKHHPDPLSSPRSVHWIPLSSYKRTEVATMGSVCFKDLAQSWLEAHLSSHLQPISEISNLNVNNFIHGCLEFGWNFTLLVL